MRPKQSLAAALATKESPRPPNDNQPAPEPATQNPPRPDVIATTIRIDPDRLERLKVIAHRRRMRVNELLLEGVDHVLALHAKTS